jgi:hypothetical protein
MGEEIAITFETLYDLLMREKQREELLELEQSFFQDVVEYLQEKMKAWDKIKQDDDLFSQGERDKIETELRNIRKIVKDLYERREKKIVDLAMNKSRIGGGLEATHLLDEEKQLFDAVVNQLDRYRQGILMQLINMKLPSVEEQKMVVELQQAQEVIKKPKETALVRFLRAVPKFIGSDLAVYGPFDVDAVASLPADVADVLVTKERAEMVSGEG